MSAEARCQANRGINAAVFRKQKKEYDSFRFLKLFCVHFCWDGTLLKALYLATFEATKKWTMPLRNWGKVYGELSIMYDGRLF